MPLSGTCTKPARAKPHVSKSTFVVAWICWSDYLPSELHRIIIFASFHCGAFPIPSVIAANSRVEKLALLLELREKLEALPRPQSPGFWLSARFPACICGSG